MGTSVVYHIGFEWIEENLFLLIKPVFLPRKCRNYLKFSYLLAFFKRILPAGCFLSVKNHPMKWWSTGLVLKNLYRPVRIWPRSKPISLHSPLKIWTDLSVRPSLHRLFKIGTKIRGTLYSTLKILTDSAVRGSLNFLLKIGLIRRSVDPWIPFSKYGPNLRSEDPSIPLFGPIRPFLDQIGGPWIPTSLV